MRRSRCAAATGAPCGWRSRRDRCPCAACDRHRPARRLVPGVSGWVRNRPFGAVEALVTGETAATGAVCVATAPGSPRWPASRKSWPSRRRHRGFGCFEPLLPINISSVALSLRVAGSGSGSLTGRVSTPYEIVV